MFALTLGKKIGLGFAVVLGLLLFTAGWAWRGVGSIVSDASQVNRW